MHKIKVVLRGLVISLALAVFGWAATIPSQSEAKPLWKKLSSCGCVCSGMNGEDYQACVRLCENECKWHGCPLCKK